jgi:uncharacterized protein with HEPN domain
MNAKISDHVRVMHILDAIKEIENYIQGADKDSFANNSMMFNATLHQLEIIGEAANGLSDEFLMNHPDTPWARIIGLRNLIIHEYFGVDDQTMWSIVTINIPQLKAYLSELDEQ